MTGAGNSRRQFFCATLPPESRFFAVSSGLLGLGITAKPFHLIAQGSSDFVRAALVERNKAFNPDGVAPPSTFLHEATRFGVGAVRIIPLAGTRKLVPTRGYRMQPLCGNLK